MKKRFLPLCLGAGLAAIVWAAAAGGGADDPLASLSYLNGTFTVAVDMRVDTALDASDALLRERAENGETAGSAALWQEAPRRRNRFRLSGDSSRRAGRGRWSPSAPSSSAMSGKAWRMQGTPRRRQISRTCPARAR